MSRLRRRLRGRERISNRCHGECRAWSGVWFHDSEIMTQAETKLWMLNWLSHPDALPHVILMSNLIYFVYLITPWNLYLGLNKEMYILSSLHLLIVAYKDTLSYRGKDIEYWRLGPGLNQKSSQAPKKVSFSAKACPLCPSQGSGRKEWDSDKWDGELLG